VFIIEKRTHTQNFVSIPITKHTEETKAVKIFLINKNDRPKQIIRMRVAELEISYNLNQIKMCSNNQKNKRMT